MSDGAPPAIPWTQDEVQNFLAAYGRAPRRMEVEQLESWWWNVVLRVEADGERLVLRRYGVTPAEEVLWELALLRQLRAHDFPTIAPLARPDGAPCGTFAGKPAILYPYVEGHNGCHPDLDPHLAMAETAALIARLHRLTQDLVLPHPRVRSGTDSRRLLAQFLRFTLGRGVAPGERELARMVEHAERCADEVATRLAPLERDLPRGIVHHDAHCGNVLFRGGRLVALIDFDDACPGYLVADLAQLIGTWAIDSHTHALRPERATHLMRSYQQYRALTTAERDLLPDAVVLFTLGDAAAYVEGRLERGAAGDEAVTDCDAYRTFRQLTAVPGWRDALRAALRD